jgi:AcrR family transcriptional regulator
MSRRRERDPLGILWEPCEPRRGRGALDRDEITAAALAIADAEGFEAVSMRRIASSLGVGTMTLYHYVPTKDDLLDLMHDAIMGELVVDESELQHGWRHALAAILRRTRDVWNAHPWIALGGERPQFGPRSLAHVDQSLRAIAELDLEPAEQLHLLGAADDFVIGFVTRELATGETLRRSGLEPEDFAAIMEPYRERLRTLEGYDAVRAFADRSDFRIDSGERFELGLTWMLDGMEAWLERRRSPDI